MADATRQVYAELSPIAEASPYPRALQEGEQRHQRDARVGFALSGGGIRSATLSLGFFQGLARLGLLKHVDILSTVSGGGYFGGFYGHLVQREAGKRREKGEEVNRDLADKVLEKPDAPWVKFLRDNGRYLSPNGAGDLFAAASYALRNWIAVITVLATFALFVFTSVTLVRLAVEQWASALPFAVNWPVSWLSPWFLMVALALPVLGVPPGWAYWLVRDNPPFQGMKPWLARWAPPIAVVVFALFWLAPTWREYAQWSVARWCLAATAATTLLTIGRFVVARVLEPNEPQVQRQHLSRGFTRALTSILLLVLIASFDSIGLAIASFWSSKLLTASGGAAAFLGIFRKPVLDFVTRMRGRERPPVSTKLLALVASVVLVLITLGSVASIPYFVAYGPGELPTRHPVTLPPDAFVRLLWLEAVTLVLALAAGRLRPFVNRSSLHALYESRLRRAYLGATNPARLGEGETHPPITEPDKNDSIPWRDYDPSMHGGPLHLINVTINETVHGRSQVEQRDRKGLAMAIGPAGVSVGRTHHALWAYASRGNLKERFTKGTQEAAQFLWKAFRPERAVVVPAASTQAPTDSASTVPASTASATADEFRVFPSVAHPELLDVAQWMAISGGAVSTGIGARTSPSLSVLLGFFNVRLGYWWRSGVAVARRLGATDSTWLQQPLVWLSRLFPVQISLLDEWSARFPGIARSDWYLTDGGHFENLGAYELVRRRLPFMIVCDFEADPDYAYGGLGNLVRKARIDFGAEITFLSDPQVQRKEKALIPPFALPECIGSLDSLRRGHRTAESVPAAGETRPRQRNDGANEGFSLVHGALARVTYPPGKPGSVKEGWLLYVKASLDGDEPADVLQYHTDHPLFPQESTADQFFDESQWESYRCLGEHMATQVFADESLRKFMPWRAEG